MFLDQPLFILLPLVVFYYVIPLYLGHYLGRCDKAPVNLLLPVCIIALFYLVRPNEFEPGIYIIAVISPALILLLAGYVFGLLLKQDNTRNSQPYVIGITGLPCSGKSEACKIFSKLGAKVIDVDRLGHKCLEDKEIIANLQAKFGSAILGSDQQIERANLAQLVFNSEQNLKILERIIHPEMLRRIEYEIKYLEPEAVLVLDAAILHHLQLDKLCKRVLVTYSDKDKRIDRAQSRSWSAEELEKRDAAVQKSLSYRDITLIENNDSKEHFINSIDNIWKEIINER